METFKLIEKRNDNADKICYLVKISKDAGCGFVKLLSTPDSIDKGAVHIGGDIKETKRGWTFVSWFLTSKPIKIFLPRENFEKVEIEE